MATATSQAGFVCPTWALNSWTRSECTIEKTTEAGVWVVLDHSIQSIVFRGTKVECESFMRE